MAAEEPILNQPTALHSRVAELSRSNLWASWAGFTVASSFGDVAEEARAISRGIGIADFSPHPAFEVRGAEARLYLDRLLTRSVSSMEVHEVKHALICAGTGHLISQVTALRMGQDHFVLFCASECGARMGEARAGLQVSVDPSTRIAIALLGPDRGKLLRAFGVNQDPDEGAFVRDLDHNGVGVTLANLPGALSPGYGASLVLVDDDDAGLEWDRLIKLGQEHDLTPVGIDALERNRIDLGVARDGFEFTAAPRASEQSDRAFPDELGLGGLVEDDGRAFAGAHALRQAKPSRELVCLEVDQVLPLMGEVVRAGDRQVGVVTSAYEDAALGVTKALALVERGAGTALAVGPSGADIPAFVTPVQIG